MLWGREVLPFPRIFPDRAWTFGDVVVTSDNVIVSGTVLGLMVVLVVLFNVTRLGRLLQAVFQSQRGAALIGLNVNAVHAIVWGAGAALAALGVCCWHPSPCSTPTWACGCSCGDSQP